MPWESLGSLSTGQMPDDEPWILFCHELAKKYLLHVCGNPPDACEIGTFWQGRDLGAYPCLGLYREYSTWDSDKYLSACEAALEKFDSAVDWYAIKPEFDDEVEEIDGRDLDEDKFAFQLGVNAAEMFMLHPDINQNEIIVLQNVIEALKVMPSFSHQTKCTFIVNSKASDHLFGDRQYIAFELSESSYQISKGTNAFAHSNLVDNSSKVCFFIGSDGEHSGYYDLSHLEQTILDYLNHGAEVVVYSESSYDEA